MQKWTCTQKVRFVQARHPRGVKGVNVVNGMMMHSYDNSIRIQLACPVGPAFDLLDSP